MSVFKVIIRIVFLFAYGAFLYASLHHVAYFYHSFEQDSNNWFGSYALAVAIDVTALVLMIGVMFFHKGMSLLALIGTWFFIFCLTGFSWTINWEYAVQFQSAGLDKVGTMYWINPIMASAFAFLNLAYSVVAGFFNSESESVEELQKKVDDLKQTSALKAELAALKNQQLSHAIAGKVQVFRDAFTQQENTHLSEQELEETDPELLSQETEEVEREMYIEDEDTFPVESDLETISDSAIHLGMIEQAMHDAFMQYPEEATALQALSQEQSLDEFVATLQEKYSTYASYITPARVSKVMGYIKQQSVPQVKPKDDPEIRQVIEENKRKYLMTFEEASIYTGYSIQYLKGQVKRHEIEIGNSGKLKVSSLRVKSGHTAELAAVKVPAKVPATNGHH